jgi:hypothetical protein
MREDVEPQRSLFGIARKELDLLLEFAGRRAAVSLGGPRMQTDSTPDRARRMATPRMSDTLYFTFHYV